MKLTYLIVIFLAYFIIFPPINRFISTTRLFFLLAITLPIFFAKIIISFRTTPYKLNPYLKTNILLLAIHIFLIIIFYLPQPIISDQDAQIISVEYFPSFNQRTRYLDLDKYDTEEIISVLKNGSSRRSVLVAEGTVLKDGTIRITYIDNNHPKELIINESEGFRDNYGTFLWMRHKIINHASVYKQFLDILT